MVSVCTEQISVRCIYKRNLKGTPIAEKTGYVIGCGYMGECRAKKEVNI